MANSIFSLIPEIRLRDMLKTLQDYTLLPIRLLDREGNIQLSFDRPNGYCMKLKQHVFTQGECEELHRKSGERARKLGTAYIFTCHANLNHIAYPLLHQGELIASILIGPFLMDKPDSTLVAAVMEEHPLSPALALELYDDLAGIRIITPERVNHLSRLLDHLLSPLMPDGRSELLLAREKLSQQSRINETIQMYKEQRLPSTHNFLHEKESALLAKVRAGNMQEAKKLLNDLLGYVLFSEGGKLNSIRLRAIELTTLLSRISMDGGAHADSIYSLNAQYISLISQEQSIDHICYLLQEIVEGFMDGMFSPADNSNAHIRRALQYMANHYALPITAASVAEELDLSPNYFSALFREVTGEHFRQRLTHIRIEESKQLLLSTNAPLSEIAVSVGFADQSCYCKAFKRMVGITPGQFRC